jgi:hypothetical protein
MYHELQSIKKQSEKLEMSRTEHINKLLASLETALLHKDSILTKFDLNQLETKISDYQSITDNLSKEQAILRSLCFRSMTVRQSQIPETYSRTYRWIYEPYELLFSDPRSHVKLTEWFQSTDSLYWISGKAGSGKSTLMKFLFNNYKTQNLLNRWAGTSPMITAAFYFWLAGTPMQRSQQGLLQSLLFRAFSQWPDLIQIVCPNRLKSRLPEAPWDLTELFEAFRLLQGQHSVDIKFCFFIDGLDEYDGDHFDLIEILKTLSKSRNIKICISSRPWPCFEDAFGQNLDRKLYMQDLTRDDIAEFARGKLEDHVNAASLLGDISSYHVLMEEIVNRAQGVFIWVFLVVRSLREGLSNGDGILRLDARLRSLPCDLEALFRRMLDSVDDIYKSQVAVTFQVALISEEPLLAMTCSYLEEEDPDFTIKLPICRLTEVEIKTRKERLQRRLSGSYKGLLEIHEDESAQGTYHRYLVGFLHRTVRDFLAFKEIQILLDAAIGNSRHPSQSFCRALLGELKTDPRTENMEFRSAEQQLQRFLAAARQAETQSKETDMATMDEFERFMEAIPIFSSKGNQCLLHRAIREQLFHYVIYRLDKDTYLVRASPPLLATSLDLNSDLTDMTRLLLRYGASPNQCHDPCDNATVWDAFMGSFPWGSQDEAMEQWQKNLKTLLLYGAVDINRSDSWSIPLCEGYDINLHHIDNTGDVLEAALLFFAHGADPNQTATTGNGRSVWEEFLSYAHSTFIEVGCRSGESHEYFSESLLSLFLQYGANPQCSVEVGRHFKPVLKAIEGIIGKSGPSLEKILAVLQSETDFVQERENYARPLEEANYAASPFQVHPRKRSPHLYSADHEDWDRRDYEYQPNHYDRHDHRHQQGHYDRHDYIYQLDYYDTDDSFSTQRPYTGSARLIDYPPDRQTISKHRDSHRQPRRFDASKSVILSSASTRITKPSNSKLTILRSKGPR